MKKYLLILTTLLSFSLLAQQKPVASPPAVVKQKVGDVEVMIKYAQPSVKGRLVFGTKEQKALVPYGEIWRTGANDATTIEFSKDVTVQGKALAKGVYSLLTIPGQSDWTIIFNNDSKISKASVDFYICFVDMPFNWSRVVLLFIVFLSTDFHLEISFSHVVVVPAYLIVLKISEVKRLNVKFMEDDKVKPLNEGMLLIHPFWMGLNTQ
jgi:hypothetical protein